MNPRDLISEDPRLYAIARNITHDMGMDWTDPRTNKTYKAPKRKKMMKKKAKKS